MPSPDALFEQLSAHHRKLDASLARLSLRHRDRLQCQRGCSQCCVDGIQVLEIEAELIRHHHRDLLEEAEPAAPGTCAFLDPEGACRVYPHRPGVCRSEGLPLRWYSEAADGSPVEHRDICPLNDRGTPITSLPADDCWLLGPKEAELAELQLRRHGAGGKRIPLRELFTDGKAKR